jgi:hypothetical protein
MTCRPHAGRVRQRAEQVHDGRYPELFPHRAHMAHGRVIGRREQEHQARPAQHGRRPRGRHADVHPHGLQHVGRARAGGVAPVPVLRHRNPRARDHERGRGRDVERAHATAAGAARVDQAVAALGVQSHHGAPKGLRRTGDFPGRLALGTESQQQGGGLDRRGLPPHDHTEGRRRFLRGEGRAERELLDGVAEGSVLGHGRSRSSVVEVSGEASKNVFVEGVFCQS